jgi:hypothetical protein
MFVPSRWLVASLAVTSVGAGALATLASGCSSSSSPASPDASTDGSLADTGIDAEVAQGDGACHVDASLTAFAESDASAAPCAKCVNLSCAGAIETCASDCTCIALFQCLADAGVAAMGLGSAASAAASCAGSDALSLLNNPGVSGLVTCLQTTCAAACPADGGPVGVSSADAGAEMSEEEAGADAADATGD